MKLGRLEDFLLWVTVVMVIITITMIVTYYWRTRQKGSNYLRNDDIMLRYFVQKQVDRHGKVIGYECLLRTRNQDGRWVLPDELESLPLQRVITLLESTFQSLTESNLTLSIKLSYNQIMSADFQYFVRWALSKIEPMQLAVEFSVKEMDQVVNRAINKRKLRRQIQIGRDYGMLFSVNNVGSSLNDLRKIEWLLAEIDILKVSMSSFRKEDPNEWLDLNLQFWNKLAKENQIELVLVGIENDEDQALAEMLQINARQGYLFGRPEHVHRKEINRDED
jgi:EAL domain-containing protein (putative c-di-GMP-specific phosphodiesterase class I)